MSPTRRVWRTQSRCLDEAPATEDDTESGSFGVMELSAGMSREDASDKGEVDEKAIVALKCDFWRER